MAKGGNRPFGGTGASSDMLNYKHMNNDHVPLRRSVPLHTAVQQPQTDTAAPENIAMQPQAAASNPMQQEPLPHSKDFTISVEQVREHFRVRGLSKSKDTVQRCCRTGELTCRKSGVLGRYFTTETSLLKLEQKLLPDMIAENAGAASRARNSLQRDAAALAGERSSVNLHAPADEAARSGTQLDEVPNVQVHAAVSAAQETNNLNHDNSRLAAEVEGLREQLKTRDQHIDFLQEEIRSSRDQRNSVVQISNRMLETLETMAIGGRLERPSNNRNAAPVDLNKT